MSSGAMPILIVEDSAEDFEITVHALRLANLRSPVLHCANGKDVTSFLQHHGEFSAACRPSLILLDLNLGGTDGRKLIRQIRETEWLHSVPIMVLTTSSNPADIELCYAAGANSYLVKPLNLERFETMILNLITFWFDTAALPQRTGGAYAGFSD